MTFLNPLVLFGLAAASIPIIIHLLSLRKLRTIEFSSLRFLKELQKSRMRRVRLRQILLLIIRTLLVAALVLAFSRPALRGSLAATIGGKASTTMVVLLDDSPSMGIRSERGELFTEAKAIASRIIRLAKEGDRILLATFSETHGDTQFPPFVSAQTALATLEQTGTVAQTVPLDEALSTVRKTVEGSQDANREVYIITDGQASQLIGEHPAPPGSFDSNVRFFFVQLSSRQRENTAVTSVVQKTQIVAMNRPVTFQAEVRNFGERPVRNSLMSIYLEGSRVVQQSLDIPSGGVAAPTFTVTPRHRGIIDGYIQLEDDQLVIDNRRNFVLDVPGNISVFLFGETLQSTKLPYLALTLAGDTSIAGLYTARQETEDRLAYADLNLCDVLMLCGIKDLTSPEVARIEEYVRRGGGLIVFPGKETDQKTYNAGLLPRLGIPPCVPINTAAGSAQSDKEGVLSFEKIDFAHPMLAGLFDQPFGKKTRPPPVASPRITAAFEPRAGERGHTIIGLSDGGDFLTEFPVGAGRVLLCAVDCGLLWSDFPFNGLFAPFLHSAALYLASQHQTSPAFVVGERVHMSGKINSIAPTDVYFFKSPSGVQSRVAPKFLTSSGIAQCETAQSSEPGVYQLMRSSGGGSPPELIQAAAVNVSPMESDLRPATPAELELLWSSAGISPSQVATTVNGQNVEQTIQQSRFGVELWRYLLGLALLLACAEIAVSRELKDTAMANP